MTVAIATPSAVMAACNGEANASAATSGPNMMPIAISTTSILARVTCEGDNGAVATRSAASSPEIVSQARPPESCPAAITMTGVISTIAVELSEKLRHSISAGGTQIQQLHQRLRHQPRIAPQQRKLLPAQRLLARAGAE